jgi:hypothetical protein
MLGDLAVPKILKYPQNRTIHKATKRRSLYDIEDLNEIRPQINKGKSSDMKHGL